MRIDSRKPKAAALSAALAVALLAGAGATDAHAATLSDTVGSAPSEATLVQPVDYRGDGYGSMQEWNASMEAKRDSLEMRAQIIMNMYGDYATDDERAVLQGCIDGAGSLLTMGEVDAKSTELDELLEPAVVQEGLRRLAPLSRIAAALDAFAARHQARPVAKRIGLHGRIARMLDASWWRRHLRQLHPLHRVWVAGRVQQRGDQWGQGVAHAIHCKRTPPLAA